MGLSLFYEHLTANRNRPSVYHPTRFKLNVEKILLGDSAGPLNGIQDAKMPGTGTVSSWFKQLCFLFREACRVESTETAEGLG